jgi:hypothetical protein
MSWTVRTNAVKRHNDNKRPVREKLKKTSIAVLPKYGVCPTEDIGSEEIVGCAVWMRDGIEAAA